MKGIVSVESASASIDEKIKQLGDWRGKTLAHLRQLIHDADPGIQEESNGRSLRRPALPSGLMMTSLHGRDVQAGREAHLCCGASIEDPKKLFNSSLEGNVRRAIDLREGEKIDEAAFRQLIRAAVAANSAALAQWAAKKK